MYKYLNEPLLMLCNWFSTEGYFDQVNIAIHLIKEIIYTTRLYFYFNF